MDFKRDEISRFVARFEATPAWSDWRRECCNGRDVLILEINGRVPLAIRIAKDSQGRIMAHGLDGWGLMIGEDLDAVLDIVDQAAGVHQAA